MISVVTNIDADHLVAYSGDIARLRQGFLDFLHNLPFYGLAVMCSDDEHTRALIPDALFEMTQAEIVRPDDPEFRSPETFLREARRGAADNEQVVAHMFNAHILSWAPRPMRERLLRAVDAARQHGRFDAFLAALDMARTAQAAFVSRERRQEVMRHMDGLNVLFADGHVKYVPWREMHQPRYCLLPEHP